MVLKIPDGSFSRGVYKCDDAAELKARIKELLQDSDLLIGQEFLPTSFDWRIGVLDGEAIFACKYHMVDEHWQVMKYDGDKTVGEGDVDDASARQGAHGGGRDGGQGAPI